jgi:DNA-binding MarR family transcriptional regulator
MQVTAPELRQQLTAELLDALMGVGRRFRRPSANATVDAGSFWLLKSLLGDGPVRPTDLAASMALDISTVSRHLAQLHRAGLVEKSADPDDRRAQRVQLSPDGRAAVGAALGSRRALLQRSLSSWTDDDVQQLHRLTTRMLASLESTEEGPQDDDR